MVLTEGGSHEGSGLGFGEGCGERSKPQAEPGQG